MSEGDPGDMWGDTVQKAAAQLGLELTRLLGLEMDKETVIMNVGMARGMQD